MILQLCKWNMAKNCLLILRCNSAGLNGNPLPAEIMSPYMENNGVQKLLEAFLENLPGNALHLAIVGPKETLLLRVLSEEIVNVFS